MNIQKSIRLICAERDITHGEFADMAGLSHVTISKLMNNRIKCSQRSLEAMAAGVGIPVSQFIAMGEDKNA